MGGRGGLPVFRPHDHGHDEHVFFHGTKFLFPSNHGDDV
jgi:hypothetical protein